MKKLIILILISSFYLTSQNQEIPNQFTPPEVPKEPITQEAFQKALDFISYAEGYRTAQTVKNLPVERINANNFIKGFEDSNKGKEYNPDKKFLQEAQQTLYFYQAQKVAKEDKKNSIPIDAFKNNKDKIKLENGIEYRTIKKGNGQQIKFGNIVEIHYKGFLTTGRKFDDSYERQETISLKVEEGQIISGWANLFPLLQAGQIVETLIPASLAYGDVATRGIPANSDLFFIIEIISVKTDKSTEKSIEK